MLLFPFLHQLSFAITPGLCVLCNQPSRRKVDLCSSCESELPKLGNGCVYCGEPLPSQSDFCARCLGEMPPFSAVLCAFDYAHPADHLIQKFKDSGDRAAGYVLTLRAAEVLDQQFRLALTESAIVTSVPLHRRKLRIRGFNQARLIGDWLSARLQITAQHDLVVRVRDTDSQRGLDAKARQKNLEDAFKPNKVGRARGKTVVLVDDVVTTTSTVREISRILIESGAADVIVFALARTTILLRTTKDEGYSTR